MAAFMYVAATIETTSKVFKSPESVVLRNPTVIELYAKTEMRDIARRYRRLKSVDDRDTVVIVPISDGYVVDRKTVLVALSSQFTYATLVMLTTGSNPMLSDTMYIESGVGMTELSSLIPDYYTPTTTSLSVNLAIDYNKYQTTI